MIEIRTISTSKEIEQFIDFRSDLYKDDPYAFPFLFSDEKNVLSKTENPSFEFCEAEYYMAYRDGKPVGRIAAIINRRANEEWNRKNVRFGFFDTIDDLEVAEALMDKVREYGRQRGMENIIGPMGFTDMDREGMLVEGFDSLGTLHANHNFPYYPVLMDKMGFEKDNDWLQQMVKVPEEVPEKFSKIAKLVGTRYHLKVRKLSKKELVKQGMGRRFFQLLNQCYSHLYEFSQLSERQIDILINTYIALADTNLLTFVFDETIGDGPEAMIGFGISLPSFSEAMKKTRKGRLFPFGWYHLAKVLFFHKTDIVDLLLIGVLPEYRAKGANALIFDDLIRWYQKYGFKEALALSMMETNNGVLDQWQYLEARTNKRLRSYKGTL